MNLQKKLESIEDFRNQSYITYKLSDVLTIVMSGVICGLDSLEDLVIFAKERVSFFKDMFKIDKIPSKSTFSRILSVIDGKAIAQIVIDCMKESVSQLGDIIAVDGKAIRSTTKNKHPALQILTAYLTESGVTLAQEKIHDKTNEIPVFQNMLEYLDIKNKVITADAMHCQKETCDKIIKKKGDYVFALKENQKNLYNDIKLFFENETDVFDVYTSPVESGHGRIEERTCTKIKDISWLHDIKLWNGIKSVFAIRRKVSDKSGKNMSDETSFYISSLDVEPEKLLKITREHWKIESLHWMLDVVFNEDMSNFESEKAHECLNAFRKFALLLHKNYLKKQNKKISIKSSMLQCLINTNRIYDIFLNL